MPTNCTNDVPMKVLKTALGEKPSEAPLRLSKALSALRLQMVSVMENLELLGDGRRPETRRLRGRLILKLNMLKKRDFLLRQMCLKLELPVSDSPLTKS